MRLLVAIALAIAIQFVGAHCMSPLIVLCPLTDPCADTFPQFIVNGTTSSEWEYVRITENHWSNGPVSLF